MKPLMVVIAKAIPYLMLSAINITSILLLSVFVLGVPVNGSLVLLASESILFTLVSLSLGLLISSRAESQQTAMFISLVALFLPTVMLSGFMIITDENITFDNKEEKKEDLVDEQTLQLRKVLKTPLEDLDLSVRAFNCLKAAKINSLSELVQYEQEDLMKFRNFGQKSLAEIEQVLTERGLHFGMDLQKLGIDLSEV